MTDDTRPDSVFGEGPGDPTTDPMYRSDCSSRFNEWLFYCTRQLNHTGVHAAGTGASIGKVWA